MVPGLSWRNQVSRLMWHVMPANGWTHVARSDEQGISGFRPRDPIKGHLTAGKSLDLTNLEAASPGRMRFKSLTPEDGAHPIFGGFYCTAAPKSGSFD